MRSFRLLQNNASILSRQNALRTSRPLLKPQNALRRISAPRVSELSTKTTVSGQPLRASSRLTTSSLSLYSKPFFRRTFFTLNSLRSSAANGATVETPSLSQRLKKLSREYGWAAFGVYMALSALDFPFCFLAVRWLGTERIGRWEKQLMDWIKSVVPISIPNAHIHTLAGGEVGEVGEGGGTDEQAQEAQWYDHGVSAAEKENRGENASLWTQLALAYAIHKSFIFIRVPVTAAITPKVVKTLRRWGWNIGPRRKKLEKKVVEAIQKS